MKSFLLYFPFILLSIFLSACSKTEPDIFGSLNYVTGGSGTSESKGALTVSFNKTKCVNCPDYVELYLDRNSVRYLNNHRQSVTYELLDTGNYNLLVKVYSYSNDLYQSSSNSGFSYSYNFGSNSSNLGYTTSSPYASSTVYVNSKSILIKKGQIALLDVDSSPNW